MTPVEGFADLFLGRTDAYGTETGGCWRNDDPALCHAEVIRQHLEGTTPIGVYPMVPDRGDWLCGWGCVDLDVKTPSKRRWDYETEQDALEAAHNLTKALSALGMCGWTERTRSGGYHVWVFTDDWVPAASMRRALLVACQIADVPPSEVNPKSEKLAEGQLGNYVRLPYPGGDHATERRIVHEGEWMTCTEFVQAASANRVAPSVIERAAGLYQSPLRNERTIELRDAPELSREITEKLDPLAWTILKRGPHPNSDRSSALFHLANRCQRRGLAPDEALAVLYAADATWGKFIARGSEEVLKQMIMKVYS